VAQFETEVRKERQMAGIEAARQQNGGRCPWGGRERGVANRATAEKADVIRQLRGQGRSVAEIARAVGLTRQTIYRILTNE
jgi:DNA invertase Pin-like site-specific DNA recombinase